MPRRCEITLLALIAVFASVTAARGQDAPPKVSLAGLGLVSIQPVNDAYIGSPYLDEGLGGIGPGFAVGVRAAIDRLALAVEYSWATLEVEQSGRLVGGTATGGLQDGLLSFLIGGGWWPSSSVELTMLGGPSLLLGSPTRDGVPIDQVANPADEGEGTLSLTVGSDLTKWCNQRIGLTAGARYTLVPRSRRAEEFGIGRHVIRAGVGVEIKLGR